VLVRSSCGVFGSRETSEPRRSSVPTHPAPRRDSPDGGPGPKESAFREPPFRTHDTGHAGKQAERSRAWRLATRSSSCSAAGPSTQVVQRGRFVSVVVLASRTEGRATGLHGAIASSRLPRIRETPRSGSCRPQPRSAAAPASDRPRPGTNLPSRPASRDRSFSVTGPHDGTYGLSHGGSAATSPRNAHSIIVTFLCFESAIWPLRRGRFTQEGWHATCADSEWVGTHSNS